MKTWTRKKRWVIRLIIGGLILSVLGGVGVFAIALFNPFHAHEHCMKSAGMSLMLYAGDHGGKFPFHTNGFGDALLLMLDESREDTRLYTAPGDDGTLLKECLKSKADVPESRCTRSYVQGLTDTNNPEIALLFDRYPTRGGDHFRRPWGPKLRDVWLLGGGMEVIPEKRWANFRNKQIELLIAEGISRREAEAYYEPPQP